jgi:hypothetical protein
MPRKPKRTQVTRHEDFFVVNRSNKETHAVSGANGILQVTTEPEVIQASLGSTNLQDNTV